MNHSREKLLDFTALCLWVIFTSVLIWERPISDGYWILIGLIALTIWAGRAIRGNTFPEHSFTDPQ